MAMSVLRASKGRTCRSEGFSLGFLLYDSVVLYGVTFCRRVLNCTRRARCSCHNSEVKHLAALPRNSRNLWWTAGADGGSLG